MKSEKIFDAITQIPDEFIHEATSVKMKRSHAVNKGFLAVAASILVLICMSGSILLTRLSQKEPGDAPGGAVPAAESEQRETMEPKEDAIGNRERDGEENPMVIPLDYSEIFTVLQKINEENPYFLNVDMEDAGLVEEAVPGDAAPKYEASLSRETGADQQTTEIAAPDRNASDSDYSGTNTQVRGVDEADVVKTDGEYIYRLCNDEVVILRADGRQTSVVSRVEVAKQDTDDREDYAFEMYLSGDRLMVLKSYYGWSASVYDRAETKEESDRAVIPYGPQEYVAVEIYDITDRARPKPVDEVGQAGYYVSSRLVDGILYLVSNHTVYDLSFPERPETYIPSVFEGGDFRTLEPDCICIGTNPDFPQYVVVSAISVAEEKILSSESVLGGAAEIYMNAVNLYVARPVFAVEESEPYEEGNYTVRTFEEKSRTELIRFSLNDGDIHRDASGSVDGTLLNQFSMDETDGYLRIVTTTSTYSYTMYTDEEHDWVNYEYGENGEANALFVLSQKLVQVGSIENLAPDERVYSVRFDGEVGYFVTFRQVDPLFTVDLSDPTNPAVMSKLKIPGFSQYLHVFEPGRLFGLGMDANEETGRTGSMKLSMFDVSDPYDVTQKHTLLLEDDYSAALHNHKAILISADRDLIAFPAETGYSVYGYSDEKGFYPKAQIDIDIEWTYSGDARGLYIDDFFYVVNSESVYVFRLTDFSKVKQISIA